MAAMDDRAAASATRRKRLGAWYTPEMLVEAVVEAAITTDLVASRRAVGDDVVVVDPACGDGRFLAAAARRVAALGGRARLVGIDVDAGAVASACTVLPEATFVCGDGLVVPWGEERVDLVVGNPPFLSQLARATTRGGAGSRGVGTYGDVAAEFLALAADVVARSGGRLAMVLPQSILSSRDATDVRRKLDARATLAWSWWSPTHVFDAQVLTCALVFDFAAPRSPGAAAGNWTHVVTERQAVPLLPVLSTAGTLGDRATLNANFRDQYYGLAGAVGADRDGPPLVTSGLIDPGRCWWDERPITFQRRRITRPRVDLGALDEAMQRWAARRLVPKVLVANQTAIIEAVADPAGAHLPGVPVVAAYPTGTHWDDAVDRGAAAAIDVEASVWQIAAVLTSPTASAWLWHQRAGTGLSAGTVRASPAVLAALPWPAGSLDAAVAALRGGDVRTCGAAVDAAYGADDPAVFAWWEALLQRIEARAARPAADDAAPSTPTAPSAPPKPG